MTSLADALFTKTQQRVLTVLFGQPDRSFYSNEIVRLADVGIGSVQRELGKLSSAGVLLVSHHGNQKHFQVNKDCPIYEELASILRKTSGLADVLKNTLAPLEQQIHIAFVYGSQAKGNAKAGSDVDVMLVGEQLSYSEVMENLIEVEQTLGRSVNPTLYSPQELLHKLNENNAFLQRVMEQSKIFLKGSEDDIRKLISHQSAQGGAA